MISTYCDTYRTKSETILNSTHSGKDYCGCKQLIRTGFDANGKAIPFAVEKDYSETTKLLKFAAVVLFCVSLAVSAVLAFLEETLSTQSAMYIILPVIEFAFCAAVIVFTGIFIAKNHKNKD